MRILKKTADILNAAEDALILALCLILFFAGIYCLADSARLYGAASDRSLLIYRPEPGGTLDSSRLITENQVAWIRIDGTDVDFPVLQGKDNSEYLNKDPYGEFSFSGSIFLDSRCDGGFLDGYSVIYGHHMSGGYMFGCLDRFLEEGYLKSHAKGTLTAKEKVYELRLFAAAKCSASDRAIFGLEERGLSSLESYINGIACVRNEAEGERIIALTTCTDAGDDSRLAVFGYITETEETQ